MRTYQWKLESAGTGKYHVRLNVIGNDDKGNLIPGLIIGASGNWRIQIGGNQLQERYKTRNEAAAVLIWDVMTKTL